MNVELIFSISIYIEIERRMSEVIPGIYLGSEDSSEDEDFLRTNNITAILDLRRKYLQTSSQLEKLGIFMIDAEYHTKSQMKRLESQIDELVRRYSKTIPCIARDYL